VGAGVVGVVALGERIAYPGVLDFSSPYRITARFWEMHVGGAAIDAYLALAIPCVAWAVWRARTPWRFALAALLAVLAVHAALVTFARGVWLGVMLPLAGLAAALAWRRWRPGTARAPAGTPVSTSAQRRLVALAGALAAFVLIAASFAADGPAGTALAWLAASVALLTGSELVD